MVMISIQLFNITAQVHDWYFKDDEKAPRGDAGEFMCWLAAGLISVVCGVRAAVQPGISDPFIAVFSGARDLGLGFVVVSIVFTAVAVAKAIGLIGAAQLTKDAASHRKEIGFSIGAILIGALNLIGSMVTIGLFVQKALKG